MDILRKETRTINIVQPKEVVLALFLRVFLAQIKLTDKQLDVAGALISRYAVYAADGVKEPYASTLLFSTNNRREIVEELGISAAHLNNTLSALEKKGILAKDSQNFILDPGLIPCNQLVFNFVLEGTKPLPAPVLPSDYVSPTAVRGERPSNLNIKEEVPPEAGLAMIEDAKQRQDNQGSIEAVELADYGSAGGSPLTAQPSAIDNTEEEESNYIPSKSGLSDSDSGAYEDSPRPRRSDDYS